jgi:hypothetical protein
MDDPDVIPELEMRFDVVGTTLEGMTLKKVLRWAYQRYVLKQEMLIPSLAEPIPA